ncbi:TetR/AcrR family transcriptional regulator [Leptospira sp. 96542]|nr:TetR/AcrR family transcriptional regulator [Leptospira sp. 96542]
MGNKGGSTKQKMIETMAFLLEETGYSASGIAELGKETGTPRGSLYFHFPGGKEELARLALLHSGNELNHSFQTILSNAETPTQAIKQIFGAMEARIVGSDYKKGCPIATTAMETSGTVQMISETCNEVYASWLKTFDSYLVSKGYTLKNAKQLSLSLFSLWEGALLLSKLQKSPEPLRVAAKTAELFFKQP